MLTLWFDIRTPRKAANVNVEINLAKLTVNVKIYAFSYRRNVQKFPYVLVWWNSLRQTRLDTVWIHNSDLILVYKFEFISLDQHPYRCLMIHTHIGV